MFDKHKLASAFHALGMFTFPVSYVQENGKWVKKPSVKWRNAPIPEKCQDFQNYGVRLDARYIVVDVDVKGGKKGADTWQKMRAMLSEASRKMLDDTVNRLVCATMTGGRHHFFRLPEGFEVQKNLPNFPDIDFLSEGAYIVGPGTNFDTGLPYAIVSGAVDDWYIPDYPIEWQIATVKRETEYRAEPKDFTNSPAALNQFEQYCHSCPAAIEFTGGDNTTYKTAATARDLGIDKDHCFRIMWDVFNPRCQPMWDEGAIEGIITNAYEYAKGPAGSQDYSHMLVPDNMRGVMDEALEEEGFKWNVSGKGAVISDNEHNAICYLVVPNKGDFKNELWGIFRFNAFTDSPEYAVAPPWYNPATSMDTTLNVPKAITDAELGCLKHYLFQKYGYEAERSTLYRAIDFVARRATYHPIRAWLKSLVWDGKPRLDSWLAAYCGAEDNSYTRAVGPKVFLGAVSRIMEPGCKMDYTIILEGEQGTGKSTVCEIMGVKPEWYAIMRPDMDKDARQVLSRKWIVEYAEIDALGKREATAVKAFMATSIDTYRAPYGKGPQDYPRQSIFMGTVNPGASYEYLNDPTGARRFWPVATGDINTANLRRDIAQLYAEAVQLYRNGALRYIGEELQEVLKAEVKKRQYIDPFIENIRTWEVANPDIDVINIQWLACNACHIRADAYDSRIRKRMVDALSYMGWTITGKLKQNARPKSQAPREDAFEVFMRGLPKALKEIRATLTEPKSFSYQYLARRWELGPVNPSMIQRMSRAIREIEGVSTEWDTLARVSKVVFQPEESNT